MWNLKMGFRSVLYRKKQYLSLFLVCVVGAGLSLFCVFLVSGMLNALNNKARIYYGGDLQFLVGQKKLQIYNSSQYLKQLQDIFPKDCIISGRIDFDADESAFYFEGTSVRQRVIKGVDFQREQSLFENFNYADGDASDIYGTNGVLLSEPIAKQLNVHVGDAVTLMCDTYDDQKNTVELIVKGIFIDSSVFGMYTSYMDIEFLRKATYADDDWCNRIGIFFPKENLTEKKTLAYQKELEKFYTMHPISYDKNVFYSAMRDSIESPLCALIPLEANLAELKIIIDAMSIISKLIIYILTIIVVAGIASTYRVLVMKRIDEIGIFKAVGMKRSRIFTLLLTETSVLVLFGCIFGFIFSLILCIITGTVDFSIIPAFDVFLNNGHIEPKYSFSGILSVCVPLFVTTMLAVMFAVVKAVKITPVEALAVTE